MATFLDDADLLDLRLGMLREEGHGMVRVLLADDDREAHAHVEGLVHLVIVDVALLLEEVEDRLRRHRGLDHVPHCFFEPRQVPQSAARDVREAMNVHGLQQGEDLLDVDPGRRQHDLADGLARVEVVRELIRVLEPGALHDLPGQGVAVGMDPAAAQANDDVTMRNILP